MAHAIDTSTGRAAVFVTRQPAWHKLGTVVSEAQTSEEAIKLAGLDWEVEMWPLQTFGLGQGGGVKVLDVAGHHATVRTDTGAVLGVVSSKYRVFQNRDAFDFMDDLVGERLAMYETAGALKGGRKVWMLAKLPRGLRVAGTDDVIEPYVLLANSHDGSMSLRMIPTSVRVVCQNTLNLALGRAGSAGVTIRHVETPASRVADARLNLGIIASRVERFQEEVDALAGVDMSGAGVRDYFRGVFNLPNPRGLPAGDDRTDRQRAADARLLEQLLDNFEAGENNLRGIGGTAWAAFNSVSQFVDHQGRGTGADARLNSIWFGEGDALKQRAFHAALELAQAV